MAHVWRLQCASYGVWKHLPQIAGLEVTMETTFQHPDNTETHSAQWTSLKCHVCTFLLLSTMPGTVRDLNMAGHELAF